MRLDAVKDYPNHVKWIWVLNAALLALIVGVGVSKQLGHGTLGVAEMVLIAAPVMVLSARWLFSPPQKGEQS